MATTTKPAKRTLADAKASKVFAEEERAAMVEISKERKTQARRVQGSARATARPTVNRQDRPRCPRRIG